MTNIFEQASRKKLTFNFKGTINVSDLWDLKTSELSQLNKQLGATLSDEDKYSLDAEPTKADEKTRLQMSIVQHIHTTKKEEAKAKEGRIAKAQELKYLEGLLAKQKLAEDEKLTPAQIQAKIDALKG